MKSIYIFFSLMLFSLSAVAQVDKTAPVVNQLKTESRYVIGIGNQEIGMFKDVLANLQNSSTLKVYAVCETHRIIGITVQNSAYKSYDVLRDQLLSEFPTILLFRKDDSIFNLDCKNEILKQWENFYYYWQLDY